MKKIIKLLGISSMMFLLAACQNSDAAADTFKEEAATEKTDLVQSEGNISLEELMIEEENKKEDIIEVTEKMYVTYMNDIYTNAENYLGKTIRLEGMFTSAYEESTGETYYFVYRVGPGCCGNDGDMCGLEFTTSGEIPKENDWIEVTGTLSEYEQNGSLYLTLKDSKVTVKSERGLENVYQ